MTRPMSFGDVAPVSVMAAWTVPRRTTTGDPWAEDPACYLTDAEIGLDAVAAA